MNGRRFVTGLLAALVACAGLIGAGAGSAGAAGTITVTPSTNLVGGQTVQVSGSGLELDGLVGIWQCPVAATNYNDCDGTTLVVASNSGGAVAPTPFTVRRLIVAGGQQLDCYPANCKILLQGPDFAPSAQAPIQFANTSSPEPLLTVTPSTNLADGQAVNVSGVRYPQGHPVAIEECDYASRLCMPLEVVGSATNVVNVGPSGAFSVSAIAKRVVSASGYSFDCVLPQTQCNITTRDTITSPSIASRGVRVSFVSPPRISPVGLTVREPKVARTVRLRVILDRPAEHQVRARWSLGGFGSAVPGVNFRDRTGTIFIPKDASETSIPIRIFNDHQDTPLDPLVLVVLSEIKGAVPGPYGGVGLLTVRDRANT
jgi:hypothetical protein